jgi:CO/xanthine dehydrogenase Mo-binding subunit
MGIGTAIYEEFRYDENGQLLNASFADYHIPTAHEIPKVKIGHIETPSPYTEYGIKGGGEGGAHGSAVGGGQGRRGRVEAVQYLHRQPSHPSFEDS